MENLIDEKTIKEIEEKFNIDLSSTEEDKYKPVIVLYGAKGSGKTTSALSVPGTILALSYDGQTSIIKKMLSAINPNNEKRIHVINIAGRVANLDPLLGGSIAVDLTLSILQNNKADWIVIDAGEDLLNYCERKMRYSNGATISEGVDWNLWRERSAYFDQIHNLAVAKANVGVIYTTWEKTEETTIEGKIKKATAPVWVTRMKSASNIVLHISVDERPSQNKNFYYVHVDSDKANILFRTGEVIDVTDLRPLITEEQVQGIQLKLGNEEKKDARQEIHENREKVKNLLSQEPSQEPSKEEEVEEEVIQVKKEEVKEKPKEKPKQEVKESIISNQDIDDVFKDLGV